MKNILIKIKNFFIQRKDKFRKWFIFLCVFFIGFSCGSCVESFSNLNTASAKEISDINVIDDNVFAFNLGNINQTFFRRNTGGVNNEILTSASVPMYIELDWKVAGLDGFVFNLGFGQYGSPINNFKNLFKPYTNLDPSDSEYRDFSYTYEFMYEYKNDAVPNSVLYSPTINANGTTFGANSRLYKFETMNSMYIYNQN